MEKLLKETHQEARTATLFTCVVYAVNNGYQVTDARSQFTPAGETVFSINLQREINTVTYGVKRFLAF